MVKKYSVKVFVILAVVMMLMILGNLSCFMVDVQKMKLKKKYIVKLQRTQQERRTSMHFSAMKQRCLCAIDHEYFHRYFITTVSIPSLSVWSSAAPFTDASESGPSEHIKIPQHGDTVLRSPLSSCLFSLDSESIA